MQIPDSFSPRFRALMVAPPWQWALHVPQVSDLRHLRDRTRPYVAHTTLQLPATCWSYLEQMDYDRDFQHIRDKIGGVKGHRKVVHSVDGWHQAPEQSVAACTIFKSACCQFFPPAPERELLAQSLSDIVSSYAAAINRQTLQVEFNCSGNSYARNYTNLHPDIGDDITAGIYLTGKTTTQLSPVWATGLRQLKATEAPAAFASQPHWLTRRYRAVPERSFSMWPNRQEHAVPVNTKTGTRINIFLFAANARREPAL